MSPLPISQAERVRRQSLGMAIILLREGCGWSQKQLAKRLGVDQSQWARVENGKQRARYGEVLRYLAQELDSVYGAADRAGAPDQPTSPASVAGGQ